MLICLGKDEDRSGGGKQLVSGDHAKGKKQEQPLDEDADHRIEVTRICRTAPSAIKIVCSEFCSM